MVPLSRRSFADPAASEATATIMRFNDALLALMQTGAQTTFSRRFDLIAPSVDQTFDLRAVLAVSVGASWTSLPPDQQNRLLAEFHRYTVASYVANFHNFAGQRFAVLPDIRGLDAGRVVVQTRLIPVSGDATRLDYVRPTGAGQAERREGRRSALNLRADVELRYTASVEPASSSWKTVDVLAAGSISRVAVQRSDFRRVLSHGGGDALLDSLRRKTSDLSDDMLT